MEDVYVAGPGYLGYRRYETSCSSEDVVPTPKHFRVVSPPLNARNHTDVQAGQTTIQLGNHIRPFPFYFHALS
jgi:hypothetical protein